MPRGLIEVSLGGKAVEICPRWVLRILVQWRACNVRYCAAVGGQTDARATAPNPSILWVHGLGMASVPTVHPTAGRPERLRRGRPLAGSTCRSRIAASRLLPDAGLSVRPKKSATARQELCAGPRDGAMGEGRTFTFDDADHYAAGFGDARVNLTITGCGNFKAQLTKVRLNQLELLGCSEILPRIAHISLPPGHVFLSFPLTAHSTINGFAWRKNDLALHGSAETTHQRSTRELQWGLISIPSKQLASSGEALMGRPIPFPQASRILRPPRQDALRLQRLFRGACHLAERKRSLVWDSEVTRALEQEMLHAVVHCLTADEVKDRLETRRHHAAVMTRFEDALTRCFDRKITLPEICAAIEVPERTLRMCCTEFTGVSPTRYALLQRLNRARAALKRADPSTTSVAEIARNHQFLELGRFAGIYRATFGESPSTTLQQNPLAS